MEKILKDKRPWSCERCKEGLPPIQQQTPENNTIPPGKCHEFTCKNQIRKGTDFLICSTCEKHFHKQERCSKMTRKQIEVLDRKVWSCLGCQEKVANPHPQATEDSEVEPNIRITKTKVSNLNILQLNVDSLLSKLEEFKMLLKEEDIQIFLIQETKLIMKDKTPEISGYTVQRKDRTQFLGN